MNATTKTLSKSRMWLVRLMQELGYGTIENLVVRDGEPVRIPRPRITQTFKLAGDSSSSTEPSEHFVLKRQHMKLFSLMDKKQNGVIAKLVFSDGLPEKMDWQAD